MKIKKLMQKQLSFMFLLLGTLAVFTACSSGSETSVNVQPPELNQVWTAKVLAENSDIEVIEESSENGEDATRALFVGGNDGNRFSKCWDSGDKVYVYKAGATSSLGFLTPASADWGFASATLSGTLDGSFSVDEELTLFSPAKAMDFTGQTGLIKSVSEKAYRQTTTTVAQAAENNLALSDVTMNSRTTFARFTLVDEATGVRLHPSQLVIHAVSGPDPVLKVDETGAITERGDLVINSEFIDGEYPGEIYVSRYRESETFNYTLKATVGEDIYVGPVSGQNPIASQSSLGGLMNYLRKMRKTTPATSLTVEDIVSKVFTGSAIVPANTEIVVKDGEDVLTQGTDYLYEISNNVNVGEATVSITGQADKLAQAQTKYIGNIVKTFQITQATPVIVMDASTMTLVNNTDASQNTQTRTVTRVFIDNNSNGTWDAGTDYDITALCTVTYSTDNDAVATVIASTGQVTAAGPTTCTITATVAAAQNWTTQTATYTVNVEQEVNGGNSVNPWDDNNGENTDDGKIYVQ